MEPVEKNLSLLIARRSLKGKMQKRKKSHQHHSSVSRLTQFKQQPGIKKKKKSKGNIATAIKISSSQWFKSEYKKWELYDHLPACNVPKPTCTYRLENPTLFSACGYDPDMLHWLT